MNCTCDSSRHGNRERNLSSSVGNEVVHEMQFKRRDVPCHVSAVLNREQKKKKNTICRLKADKRKFSQNGDGEGLISKKGILCV
jgi:hypothetical protein